MNSNHSLHADSQKLRFTPLLSAGELVVIRKGSVENGGKLVDHKDKENGFQE